MSQPFNVGRVRERFLALCRQQPGEAHARALWDMLEAMYQFPPRGYHSLRHIDECLVALDGYEGEIEDRTSIELALWVHDCVYDSTRKDNEERSAGVGDLACTALQVGDDRARRVHELVMATKHSGGVLRGDQAIIVDIDLWTFAADWERCVEIVDGIRQEFAWVPIADFREGRGEFLRGLLARPHLYYTPWARSRFEAKARANIERQFHAMERDEM